MGRFTGEIKAQKRKKTIWIPVLFQEWSLPVISENKIMKTPLICLAINTILFIVAVIATVMVYRDILQIYK